MKLTAISIIFGTKRLQRFAMLPYENGKAILPSSLHKKYLQELGIRRGQTYTIG